MKTNYAVCPPTTLRMKCIEKDWFNAGSNEQYDKLFEANEMGASIAEIATIIWLCTDDVRRIDILDDLNEMHQLYLKSLELTD